MTNTQLSKVNEFKQELMAMHYKTLVNYMRNEQDAQKFMSAVVYSVQKTPKLLECDTSSLMNAFMTCAQYGLFPSSASGECYIIPYEKKKKQGTQWVVDHVEAQFQLGYQGIVTLLYRSGIKSIISEIVRKEDKFSSINGIIHHEIDIFKSTKNRGEAVGAYVIFKLGSGETISKLMNKEDILKFKAFSKSAGSKFSPWNESNDPELWMWKKTVVKQGYKLLPKNGDLAQLIEKDNTDSTISDQKIIETPSEEILNEKFKDFGGSEEGENKNIS